MQNKVATTGLTKRVLYFWCSIHQATDINEIIFPNDIKNTMLATSILECNQGWAIGQRHLKERACLWGEYISHVAWLAQLITKHKPVINCFTFSSTSWSIKGPIAITIFEDILILSLSLTPKLYDGQSAGNLWGILGQPSQKSYLDNFTAIPDKFSAKLV